MESREQRRAEFVRGVAKIMRSRDFRSALDTGTGRSDSHIVVVALPDDSMRYVFDHLAQAGGSGAVVLVQDGPIEMVTMRPASAAQVQVAQEDDGVARIHEDSPVDMFFECLRQARTLVIAQHTATIIDRADLVDA